MSPRVRIIFVVSDGRALGGKLRAADGRVGYREAASSAPVANSVRGSLGGSAGSESVASARDSGNRAATVQQVPPERKEQSGSRGDVSEEDCAATPHPQSRTVPSPKSRADRGRPWISFAIP